MGRCSWVSMQRGIRCLPARRQHRAAPAAAPPTGWGPLPPALTRNARSAHLFVSVDNLFVVTGYSGLDPEVSNLNQSSLTPDAGIAARGVDYLSYPRYRTVTGGIRLVF